MIQTHKSKKIDFENKNGGMRDLGTIVSRSRKDPVERKPSFAGGWRRR